MRRMTRMAFALAAGAGLAFSSVSPSDAAKPKSGGELNFVVGSKIPSYDGHVEGTFGMIHPIAPFYSLLIRVNPDNPSAPDDFVCDLCEGDVPKAENDGKRYTFKIRKGVKFHDGTPLTAHDIKATYDKIVFPPEGVASNRKAFYKMVDKITVPDDHTVVFDLKFPSGAFLPAMASPFNFVYSKKDLKEHGFQWHKKNINGTGPFKFVEHQPGNFVSGKRYDSYHHKGQPFLDGFKAISAPKGAVRVQAIRGNRAGIEFRGFSPKNKEDLQKALGDKLVVQESDWNCVLLYTPNHKRKAMSDPRVRQALTLSVDRWGGAQHLSRIAIVRTVGGVVFPGHSLAAKKEELIRLKGYGIDHKASVEQAKKLLKEAGHAGLAFEMNNRAVDQPYKVVGTWLIGQWRQAGMKVTQNVKPSPPFYASLRKKKDFDVSVDFNCQTVVNPIVDVTKFLGSAGNNYGDYEDQELEDIYAKLERAPTEEEQYNLMRVFEKRALSDQALLGVTLWWYRIIPHRSYVKGWKISPSHYLNQQLDNVWLDQ